MVAEIKKNLTSNFARQKMKKKPNIFLKEFFIEIWFKIGGHQYIYNAEIKYGKSYCVAV